MTNLQRLTGKIFGETATATGDDPQIGQFGSALNGTYVGTTDVATIQSLPAWSNGFIDSVTPNEQFPPLPEMTGFGKVLSYQTAYTLQKGVPEWDAGTTYYTGDFAKGVGEGKLYVSLADNNLNHAVSDTTYWEEFSSGASRNIGEIVISTIPLTDAGLHLLDGTVLSSGGIYTDFVSYMGELYNSGETIPEYFCQPTGETETAFVQPLISSNGTLGGNSFAVSASQETTSSTYGGKAFNAFDGDATTCWGTGNAIKNQDIIMYNPDALKVSKISFSQWSNNVSATAGNVYGSSDNSNWILLCSWTNSTTTGGTPENPVWWDINVNSNAFYKYIKVEFTDGTWGSATGNFAFREITLTATYMSSVTKTADEVWQDIVAQYGVCGKFVYNPDTNSIRLPKYSNKIYTKDIASTVPVVGNGITLGLTDGTRNVGVGNSGGYYVFDPTEANYGKPIGTTNAGAGTQLGHTLGVTTDPENSGLIAQLSDITTSVDVYYYIVVATTTKTDIQVDIDEIATDLNGKADVDLINTSPTISFAAIMNSAGIRTVVETYQNSTRWYRVWSDGWCEQGGRFTRTATGKQSISLLKNYVNTDYSILATLKGAESYDSASTFYAPYVLNQTVSGFDLSTSAAVANIAYFTWEARGYI